MNLVLFGATGGTGTAFLKQALDAGHHVAAVARNPAAITLQHPNLTVLQGDVRDPEFVSQVIAGKDAVVSALGTGQARQPTTLYSDGARSLLEAMQATGVRRFIGITSGGVIDHDPRDPWVYRAVFKPRLRHIYEDMKRMEALVKASDLDWTLVRPTYLTNGPHTGHYRLDLDRSSPERGWRISREDVADLMLKSLENGHFIRQGVTLAY